MTSESPQPTLPIDDASGLATIESSGGRVGRFETVDGAVIRFAHWPAPATPARGGVMILPGRTEFIEKYLETAGELRARGLAVWAIDWRGQGLSSRPLANAQKGHVSDFADYTRDLGQFAREHLGEGDHSPMTLLAHSMGGNIGLHFLHDHPEMFANAVFSAPMTGIRSAGPPVRMLADAGCAIGLGDCYVPGGRNYGSRDRVFENNPLTSDERRFRRLHAFIDRDAGLALGSPTFAWLHAALRACATLEEAAYARAIRTPSLFVCAGGERIVDNGATARLCANMPAARLETVAECRHEILVERDELRARFWSLFDEFTGTAPA